MRAYHFFYLAHNSIWMKGFMIAVLLWLSFWLAACSGGQSQTGYIAPASQPEKILTNHINPCSLVTSAQVGQVLKIKVGVFRQPQTYGGVYLPQDPCDYAGPDLTNPDVVVSIGLSIYKDRVTARSALQKLLSESNLAPHIFNGLDQPAILATAPVPQLFVQKDNGMVSISVTGNDTTLIGHQEQQIAQFVLQNM